MNWTVAHTFVISALCLALAQLPDGAMQRPTTIADPDAYAIYSLVLPRASATVSKEPLLLQEETEIPPDAACLVVPSVDPEWKAVGDSFTQENSTPRLLSRALTTKTSYRLISRADIQADDARLALKYPGTFQRRPESMEYAAVSAVGFNPAKTKAMVYVRLRMSGGMRFLELRNGSWVNALGGCGWIA